MTKKNVWSGLSVFTRWKTYMPLPSLTHSDMKTQIKYHKTETCKQLQIWLKNAHA